MLYYDARSAIIKINKDYLFPS